MSRGKVKWFDAKKGYGFIREDDTGKDVFVHFSVVEMDGFRVLNEGDEVEFEMTSTGKGPQASKVTKI